MRLWACLAALCFCAAFAWGQVLFQDDFDDGDALGWEEYDGTFYVTDGAYRVQSNGFCGDARAVAGSATWTDYVVECDLMMLNREKHAILFRVEEIASGCDAGRYYQFSIGASWNGVSFCKMNYSGGYCEGMNGRILPVSDNEWHHVSLKVVGSTVTAYIDGEEVLSDDRFTDYPAGRIGLKSVNHGITLFDNVVVTAIPSRFDILSAEKVPLLTLTWSPARLEGLGGYTVERRASLDEPWMPVAPTSQWPIASTSWTDASVVGFLIEGGDRLFYRVRAGPKVEPASMVLVPAGTFMMGSPYGPTHGDEIPVHEVYISAFLIGRTELTNAEMAQALQWAWEHGLLLADASSLYNAEGTPFELILLHRTYCQINFGEEGFTVDPGKEYFPCVDVTWYGAQAYCNYRSDMEGLPRCIDFTDWSCDFTKNGYRLPTEAEWEKAARGGLVGHHYPWPSYGGHYSEHIDGSMANYRNSGDPYENSEYPYWTTPVAYYQPHGYGAGLYDMAGNVWEWVWDWSDTTWYSNPAACDPDTTGPIGPLTERVIRGASWYELPELLQCSDRDPQDPLEAVGSLGFRPVRRAP